MKITVTLHESYNGQEQNASISAKNSQYVHVISWQNPELKWWRGLIELRTKMSYTKPYNHYDDQTDD